MARVTINIDPVDKILIKRNLGRNPNAQKFFTSEVRREAEKYVPFDTGMLKNNTAIGKDYITYKSPYAAKNYYGNSGSGTEGTSRGGMRGKLWIPRMWVDKGKDIVRAVSDYVRR